MLNTITLVRALIRALLYDFHLELPPRLPRFGLRNNVLAVVETWQGSQHFVVLLLRPQFKPSHTLSTFSHTLHMFLFANQRIRGNGMASLLASLFVRPPAFPFLRLPRELRDMIYKH